MNVLIKSLGRPGKPKIEEYSGIAAEK